MAHLSDAIDAAERANSTVALEDALAKMAGIAAQLPFFDTPVGTEGESSGRHFELAPAAETTAIRTL